MEAVHLSGELIGCVLTGAPATSTRTRGAPESVRRQGSHVAPLTRRDYARDLRAASAAHEHAEATVRANRELLSPFLRARQEVVASIRQGRNHLLIGEPGVGQADAAGRPVPGGISRRGRITTLDCAVLRLGAGRRAGPGRPGRRATAAAAAARGAPAHPGRRPPARRGAATGGRAAGAAARRRLHRHAGDGRHPPVRPAAAALPRDHPDPGAALSGRRDRRDRAGHPAPARRSPVVSD